MLYKKILFQTSYLKVSCLIQYFTSHFFVIVSKSYQQILSPNCFKVNTTPIFFSVSNAKTLLRSSENTTQQRQARAGPLFMQHSVCLPARSVCQCMPTRLGNTFGPRQRWAGGLYSRSRDAHWSTDRGHRVQQIMSINCSPRAWNTVKPSAKGRELRKKRVY